MSTPYPKVGAFDPFMPIDMSIAVVPTLTLSPALLQFPSQDEYETNGGSKPNGDVPADPGLTTVGLAMPGNGLCLNSTGEEDAPGEEVSEREWQACQQQQDTEALVVSQEGDALPETAANEMPAPETGRISDRRLSEGDNLFLDIAQSSSTDSGPDDGQPVSTQPQAGISLQPMSESLQFSSSPSHLGIEAFTGVQSGETSGQRQSADPWRDLARRFLEGSGSWDPSGADPSNGMPLEYDGPQITASALGGRRALLESLERDLERLDYAYSRVTGLSDRMPVRWDSPQAALSGQHDATPDVSGRRDDEPAGTITSPQANVRRRLGFPNVLAVRQAQVASTSPTPLQADAQALPPPSQGGFGVSRGRKRNRQAESSGQNKTIDAEQRKMARQNVQSPAPMTSEAETHERITNQPRTPRRTVDNLNLLSSANVSFTRRSSGGRQHQGRTISLERIFNAPEDDLSSCVLAFCRMEVVTAGGTVIAEDPGVYGITEIWDARGINMSRASLSGGHSEESQMPTLNRHVIDIDIDDDLAGAAEVDAPSENFRRLMSSSPVASWNYRAVRDAQGLTGVGMDMQGGGVSGDTTQRDVAGGGGGGGDVKMEEGGDPVAGGTAKFHLPDGKNDDH